MFPPPWSAVKHPTARPRRRLARACDACYARKIRCDVAKPRCNWCGHHDQECTFHRIFGTEQVSAEDSASCLNSESEPVALGVPALSQRSNLGANQAEQCLPCGLPSPPEPEVPVQEEISRSFAQNLQAAAPHLGNICTFNGMPVLAESSRDWIRACTGEEFPLGRFSADVKGWNLSLSPDQPSEYPSNPDLPDPALLLEEVALYQSSAYGMFFPIIDLQLFQSTIKAAYGGIRSPTSLGLSSAKACIFAFHALALTVIEQPERFASRPSIDYAREAYRLLPEVFSEAATLDGLQALLLLCLCSQGLAGDVFIIDYLLSAASRFVVHLKGNLSPARAFQDRSTANHHARHLFWVTFVCDKGFSLVTGLASRLDEAQCDLEHTCPDQAMPPADKRLHMDGDPIPGSYLRSYTDLAAIQSRIYLDLYSPRAWKETNAVLFQKIRDLDFALEEWRMSLALEIRPSLLAYAGEGTRLCRPRILDMRTSIFHLQYHHCMIMIHQPSSRCPMWTQNQNIQGTGSSLAIAVTASRSLLAGFMYSPFELGSQNLLFTLSYFLQASTIIFCKILARPVADSVQDNQQDLRLLRDMAKHIILHSTGEEQPCYRAKIEFSAQVIFELQRLAQCAIERVKERGVGLLV